MGASKLSVLAILSLFFSFSSSLVAETQSNPPVAKANRTIIVLDASGSMWGQIDNTAKIDIAKGVVGDLVADWDSSIELGLTVYGHRRKGDCADIESLVPVGQLAKENFSKKVSEITPVGKTPLTDAVVKAAEELKYTEDRATVILVSDGVETCDRDPCAMAKKLESLGVDFTAHVVGFDVSKEEEVAQLRCIADNTGGQFMAAQDASSLKASIEKAVQEVASVEEPKPVVEDSGVKLVAVHEPGGVPIQDVNWRVFPKPENELDKPKAVRYGKGSQPTYKLPAGTYIAEATTRKAQTKTRKEFVVLADSLGQEEVVIPVEGEVQLFAVNAAGGEALSDVVWSLFELPKDELSKPAQLKYGGGSSPKYKILPGRYLAKVSSRKGEAKAEKEIEVFSGKSTREEVVIAKEAVVKFVGVNEAGGTPLDEVVWGLFKPSEDPLGKAKQVKYGGGSSPEYRVLPGRYIVRAKSRRGKAEVEKEVVLKAGDSLIEEVLIPAEGIVELVAVYEAGGEPAENVRWELYEIEKDPLRKPKQLSYGGGAKPEYRLLPGTYMAKVKAIKGQAEAVKEVSVIAGKKNREEVIIAKEGILNLVAIDPESGKPLSDVYWELYTIEEDPLRKPKQVTYGGGAEPKYQLLPGKYQAKVTQRKTKISSSKEVEVYAGKLSREEVMLLQ